MDLANWNERSAFYVPCIIILKEDILMFNSGLIFCESGAWVVVCLGTYRMKKLILETMIPLRRKGIIFRKNEEGDGDHVGLVSLLLFCIMLFSRFSVIPLKFRPSCGEFQVKPNKLERKEHIYSIHNCSKRV